MFAEITRLGGKALRLEEGVANRVRALLEDVTPDIREMLGGLAKPAGLAAMDVPAVAKAVERLSLEGMAGVQGKSSSPDKAGHVLQALDVRMKISIVKLKIRELEQELDRLLAEAGEIGSRRQAATGDLALSGLRRTVQQAAMHTLHPKTQAPGEARSTLPEQLKMQEQAQRLQHLMDAVGSVMKQQNEMRRAVIRNLR
jgi:hypothetical protein